MNMSTILLRSPIVRPAHQGGGGLDGVCEEDVDRYPASRLSGPIYLRPLSPFTIALSTLNVSGDLLP